MGTFETFNYDATADNHLPNQDYSVCVRQEEGFCCVEYQICQGTTFALGGTTMEMGMYDNLCPVADSQDYITIPSNSYVYAINMMINLTKIFQTLHRHAVKGKTM